jgi:histidyl-tRNA synthetase
MWKRNWVLDNIRSVFEVYGFEPLGTPAFESWDMLKIKSGEDAINQIYYFKDKSERELGLRYEWTASLARVVASHRELPKPFKRYAIGPVWRYERPSEMNRREFWQMDADIIGVSDSISDTEVLAVAVDSLKSIGFRGFIIRLNDRRILESLVMVAGLERDDYSDVFRAVDKRGKIGDDGVIDELLKIGVSRKTSKKILELTSKKGEPLETIEHVKSNLEGYPKGIQGCDAIRSIVEYSSHFGIDQYLMVDLELARGLDYYTGPVFEIYAEGYQEIGSIAGGGRYDELVGLFGGEPAPMTGISMGIDRLVPILEKMDVFDTLVLGPKVYVAFTSEELKAKAIEITQIIRRGSIATELNLLNRSLRKQLDNANRRGFKKVVIVGAKELEEGCVSIRDLDTSKQRKVSVDKIIEDLKTIKPQKIISDIV